MKKPEDRIVQQPHSPQSGFTMVEMVIVVIIIVVIAAIALVQLQPTVQQFRANAAMDQVKGALRQARELAISQRRTIVVQFVPATNRIQLFQVLEPGNVRAAAPFLTLPIQSTVQFMTVAGEVDTPDAYGIPAPPAGIMFGGVVNGPPAGMQFQSDGTFDNAAGTPINGTVFLAVPNIKTTERAVTILGATGRIHAFKSGGAAGVTTWFQ